MNNIMKIEFSALAENESFARAAVASFIMPFDPTVEELTEVKTAVSEAVSNSIIHGYADEDEPGNCTVTLECTAFENGKLVITIEDFGRGIDDVQQAMQPLFSTGDSEERSGMGFTVMESFMDRIKVRSEQGKGTAVIMTKYLDVVSGL